MKASVVVIGLGLFACFSLSWSLFYVESSNGLEPPAMEGGRTELEFCDINEDGKVDIVSIGDHGNPYINTDEHGIMVWFGDGQGGWTVYQYGDFGYGGIAVGDANRDGHLDVGYGMHHNYSGTDLGDSMVEVALGDGTGRNWTPWDDGLGPPTGTWGMFCTDFADVNNDGWLDLIASTFGSGEGLRAYLNNRNGTWTQCYNSPGGNSQMDVVFGDVNNDGNVDFAAGHQSGTVFFGNGDGSFTLADHNLPSPGNSGNTGVALGDIDNDGGRELGFANAGGGIEVWDWHADGDSWVSMRGGLPGSGSYEMVQLCDMNSDGFLDVVAFGSHQGTVWTGDGAGNWTEAAGFSTPTPGYCEALRCGGDIDHNGLPDVVLVSDEGTWPSDRNHLRCFRETSVAESMRVVPVFPRGGEHVWGGSVQFIDWSCAVPPADTARVSLELSTTGSNGPWSAIADSLQNSGRFQWNVPNEPSADCYVRYTATSRHGVSVRVTPRPFTILRPTAVSELASGPGSRHLNASVCPNPAQGRAALTYDLPSSGLVRVSLSDAAGRLLFKKNQAASQGRHTMPLDVRSLPSGIYFLRIQAVDAECVTEVVVP
jgi:hypothetical protein